MSRNRSHAVVWALACAMLVPALPASDALAVAPASHDSSRLFSAYSVWNKALPARARTDSTSRVRTSALADQITRTISQKRLYPNISSDSYSTPIYRVPASTKRVPVKVDVGPWGSDLRSVAAGGVPVPRNAVAATGSDGHMTIYQPSTDTLWEFWRAHKTADGWHASWGGAMRSVSTNPGYYNSAAWPGLGPHGRAGSNWGSTASSLPVAAGTVTLRELERGRVDHALAISLPAPCRLTFAWPAQRTDGTSPARDCVPEGAHLRLDPGVDVDRLGLPPVTLMLARAAQKYGMIVRDRTGGSAAFYLESPDPAKPSPYTRPGGLYRGVPPWKMLARFPWARLQVLPLAMCRTAPCARPAARR